MGLFDRASHICSIPSGTSFVDALACGLILETASDPLSLGAMTVMLPNRRACRALQEAFLRQGASGGRALILPRLMPLGDLEEDELALRGLALEAGSGGGDTFGIDLPPAISGMRRLLLLSELVQQVSAATLPDAGAMSFDQAARLAAELARLLDQVETEGVDFSSIRNLVLPEELAEHWQKTVDFLDILQSQWPRILSAEGAVDAARRRNLLLARQVRLWRERPPQDPVIAAGSTGSIPASAELIATVAGLPRGLVILPGLDAHADAATWSAISGDPAHPQFGLAQLLHRLNAEAADVWTWPHQPPDGARRSAPPSRARMVSAAMLPAAMTAGWGGIAETLQQPAGLAQSAWREVQRIDCHTEQEEAGIIALLLREAVSEPAPYRAALVTPDRGLARRVAAELRRWDIAIDDSAGTPLAMTGPGLFFRLVAEVLTTDFEPVPLLALLKHSLATGGEAPGELAARARLLERYLLRGPRPAPGLAGLRATFAAAEIRDPEDLAAVGGLVDALEGMAEAAGDWTGPMPLDRRLAGHVAFAERLAADVDPAGGASLWRGEAGEILAGLVAEFLQAGRGIRETGAGDYTALLTDLLGEVEVRPRFGLHPRIFIWGPLEARLQQVDLMVLGGLNEGTWPAAASVDPWLSRPMRQKLGLPSPERRIGLAAHDFQQAMGAPRVVLTRALRVGGKPGVPSRWLLRLDAFLRALGIVEPVEGPSLYRGWQARRDRPAGRDPGLRPAPAPGVRYRPLQLPVTDIEKWMRDPYVIYAKRILRLRKLDPIDQKAEAADLGTLFHDILDAFLRVTPLPLPADAEPRLLAQARARFGELMDRPAVAAFWWPRFCRIAAWFIGEMRAREAETASIFTEISGSITISEVAPPFTLTAKADRLDLRRDGSLAVIDYKTGSLPKPADIMRGFSPQLPLEAAIARRGGFPGIPPAEVTAMEFWHLKGGRDGSSVRAVRDPEARADADPVALGEEAYLGLVDLVAHFSREDAAYVARPRPAYALHFNDYEHLGRYAEWAGEPEA